jgi:hypothetical protein
MLRATTARSLKEGVVYGMAAGVAMALAQLIAAIASGDGYLPMRMAASVAFLEIAIHPLGMGGIGEHTATAFGGPIHLALSAGFGLAYGALNAGLSMHVHRSWLAQIGLGLAFGLALYLINFQLVARVLYPWFLALDQPLQVAFHTLGFGLPLGLLYAWGERRSRVVDRRLPA